MAKNSLDRRGHEIFEAIGVDFFVPSLSTRCQRPLYQQPISAGFPSPSEDHCDRKLDLNRHYIKNPAATFFVTVSGDSTIACGSKSHRSRQSLFVWVRRNFSRFCAKNWAGDCRILLSQPPLSYRRRRLLTQSQHPFIV
jgi:hypothetical protein